mgnify:CR=1 FL=1
MFFENVLKKQNLTYLYATATRKESLSDLEMIDKAFSLDFSDETSIDNFFVSEFNDFDLILFCASPFGGTTLKMLLKYLFLQGVFYTLFLIIALIQGIKMNLNKVSLLFLRFSLAGSYLSAVADRFGLWGKSGEAGVVWGNFKAFLDYTQFLNSWAPISLSNFLGYTATILEVVLAILLIIGLRVKETSLVSFGLLMMFALSMIFASGIKGVFDYSVFTAAGASLLLFRAHSKIWQDKLNS